MDKQTLDAQKEVLLRTKDDRSEIPLEELVSDREDEEDEVDSDNEDTEEDHHPLA